MRQPARSAPHPAAAVADPVTRCPKRRNAKAGMGRTRTCRTPAPRAGPRAARARAYRVLLHAPGAQMSSRHCAPPDSGVPPARHASPRQSVQHSHGRPAPLGPDQQEASGTPPARSPAPPTAGSAGLSCSAPSHQPAGVRGPMTGPGHAHLLAAGERPAAGSPRSRAQHGPRPAVDDQARTGGGCEHGVQKPPSTAFVGRPAPSRSASIAVR